MRLLIIYSIILLSGSFLHASAPNSNRFSFASYPPSSNCTTDNLPAGSYIDSCPNCCQIIDQTNYGTQSTLYCQCKDEKGNLHNTGYDSSCCSSFSNQNGQLNCDVSNADDNGMC